MACSTPRQLREIQRDPWHTDDFSVLVRSIQSLHSMPLNPINMSDPKTWMCLICGWIYDEAAGAPDHGIAPGTAWADVPMNWTCPECGARKEDFEMVQI